MRNNLYKNRPSKKNTYFYSCLFVGQERPFICCSHDAEYFNIRDYFLELCNEGQFEERFSIHQGTSAMVRRIDVMKDTNLESKAAEVHLQELHENLDSLNNPLRPSEQTNLLAFMKDREEQLKIEAEKLEFQLKTEKVSYKSKEQFMVKILQRKYEYIFKDIEKQWRHLNKDKTLEPTGLSVLESVA